MMAGIKKERVLLFEEINRHLLEDDKPSEYISDLSKTPIFKEYPLNMLLQLKNTDQSPKYHPEGSVWNHTMLVLDEAAKVREQSKNPRVFMWAALLHDIGKPDTTKMRRGRLTSYDHDIVGARLATDFLQVYTDEEEFIKQVAYMVRYHMHMLYVLRNLPHGDVKNLLKQVDIDEIALLCRCDRFGRKGANREEEEEAYREFLQRLRVMISVS